MIQAFIRDKSIFRSKVIVVFCLGMVLLLVGLFIADRAKTQLNENRRLEKQYLDEKQWMNSFSFKKAQTALDSVLSPVSASDVETVHNKQLKILTDNGVKVFRASKGRMMGSRSKKKGAQSVNIKVEISSRWPNLVRALNDFEKKHLVVITGLDLTSSDTVEIRGNMSYEIFYNEGKKS